MEALAFKGGTVAYSAVGKGRALVLLHGFLESSPMWDAYTAALSKRFRVVTIDLPGHGQTDCFGYVHSMNLMAECVKAVLDHLHIRKAVFVGHSMGGYVSLAFADHFPDMLKGLCLFFSTARADTPEKKIGRDRSIALVKERHTTFIRQTIPRLFRHKNRTRFREAVNRLKQLGLQTPKQGIVAALEGMKHRPDREVIIRFAPYPVLYVIGKHDPVLPYADLIEQADQSERATYALLPESGHMGFIEEEETCLELIRQFSQRCYRPVG